MQGLFLDWALRLPNTYHLQVCDEAYNRDSGSFSWETVWTELEGSRQTELEGSMHNVHFLDLRKRANNQTEIDELTQAF